MELRDNSDTIVVGALGTVPRGLERGLEKLDITGRIETNKTTAPLRPASILNKVFYIYLPTPPLGQDMTQG